MTRKTLYISILAAVALCCSCSKEPQQKSGGGEIPPEGMAEVTLGSVAMDSGDAMYNNSSKAPLSRAGGELMAVGETFRLYAFERGKTDIRDLLVTRAYTIVGSAGVPKLNEGEKPLFLPLGDVDIYLVGPLEADINKGLLSSSGAAMPPMVVNIASENGVMPNYNADLVASKTEITVVAGSANKFFASPLIHKMARVEFCLESSSEEGTNYENLLLKNVKLYKQATTGVFVFGADGGYITAATGETDIQTFSIIEDIKGFKYRTVQYMIPRQKTELKVEVRFTCNLKGQTGLLDKRLTSGILDVPLVGGKQNYFYSHPIIATDIKWRTRILPWNAVNFNQNIDGLLLCFDGANAPETIDGKKCWRDISGNGNHAQIFGTVSHNINRYVLPGSSNNYMRLLKSLGTHQNFTAEFVVRANNTTANTTLFNFTSKDNTNNDRELSVHYPWGVDGVWFDSPYGNGRGANNRLNIKSVTSLPYPMTNVAQWQITRAAGVANGYIARMNGHQVTYMTASTQLGEMLFGYIGCFSNKSSPFGGDLYSLRMYDRVLTDDELKTNYEADKEYYNIP